MDNTFYLKQFIFPVLVSLPYYLVILIGIGFGVVRYKTYPKTSLLSIIALVIFALIQLVYIILPILNIWLMNSTISPDTFGYLIGGINVITSIFGTIALAVLIFAVWANRDKA